MLPLEFFYRFHREVAGRHALVRKMSFADAYPFHDPLICRVDHFFQVGVRQQPRGNVPGYTRNFCGDAASHIAPRKVREPETKRRLYAMRFGTNKRNASSTSSMLAQFEFRLRTAPAAVPSSLAHRKYPFVGGDAMISTSVATRISPMLAAADMEETILFYHSVLGFTPTLKSPEYSIV